MVGVVTLGAHLQEEVVEVESEFLLQSELNKSLLLTLVVHPEGVATLVDNHKEAMHKFYSFYKYSNSGHFHFTYLLNKTQFQTTVSS